MKVNPRKMNLLIKGTLLKKCLKLYPSHGNSTTRTVSLVLISLLNVSNPRNTPPIFTKFCPTWQIICSAGDRLYRNSNTRQPTTLILALNPVCTLIFRSNQTETYRLGLYYMIRRTRYPTDTSDSKGVKLLSNRYVYRRLELKHSSQWKIYP